MYEHILCEVSNGIATIALNRPEKRNAMNAKVIKEITLALQQLVTDTSVQVLLLKGNGEHFCAGADINWMQKIAESSDAENLADANLLAEMLYQLYSFPKPTIALAHGGTLGGGLGLVAACDIAFAAKDVNFGFSEVKIGITPSTISPYIIAAIGQRAAHYYFLTGTRFGAEEAMRIGLVHQVYENDQLDQIGQAFAKTFLQNSPYAMSEAKKLIREVSQQPISIELAQKTAAHLANIRRSNQAQEGLKAFLEKRSPTWS